MTDMDGLIRQMRKDNIALTVLDHRRTPARFFDRLDVDIWVALVQFHDDNLGSNPGDFAVAGVTFTSSHNWPGGKHSEMTVTEEWSASQWDVAKLYWIEMCQEMDRVQRSAKIVLICPEGS